MTRVVDERTGVDSVDPDDDAEALSWAGDEELGRGGADRPARRRRSSRSAGEREAADDDTDGIDESSEVDGADPDVATIPTPRATRVVTAIGLVVAALLTLAWIIGITVTPSGASDVLTELLWQFGEFLAVAAPLLWFFTVVSLSPVARPGVRAGFFALGFGLLFPWPLLDLVIS